MPRNCRVPSALSTTNVALLGTDPFTSGCLGLRLQLLFAITFFVNHRASGVADFPSPDDPMLTFLFGKLGNGAAALVMPKQPGKARNKSNIKGLHWQHEHDRLLSAAMSSLEGPLLTVTLPVLRGNAECRKLVPPTKERPKPKLRE